MDKEEAKSIPAEMEEKSAEIAIVDENTIRDKIYIVRGVKVMLDFDLAEIYGYTTKAFNQQVKRNEERFPSDFMFQLSPDEVEELSRSQIVTLNQGGRGSNIKYAPHAFTESGIYMLMTVLKGDLAVRQSQVLIRTFRSMKDYIIENRNMIGQHEFLQLSIQVSDNLKETAKMRGELNELGNQMNVVMDKLSNVVERSEISPFLLDLGKPVDKREYLILNGEPVKADVVYMDIYGSAEKSVYIVDDYINIKTLRLLQDVKSGVTVNVFSDNVGNQLHSSDYKDFQTEFPDISITFKKTCRMMHDRFIVLDLDTDQMKVYHCGASSKDAGVANITAITEMTDSIVKTSLAEVIHKLLDNPELILK